MQTTYRGRPSRGCSRCKQRKVKCDERRPGCDRCAKGDFQCIYRDEFDLLLKNQTEETAIKAQKKWRSRAKTASPILSPNSYSSPSSSKSRVVALPQNNEIRSVTDAPALVNAEQSLYDLVDKRFISDFVIEGAAEAPKQGYTAFITNTIKNGKPGTCEYHALRATSLSNYAARCKSLQATDMGWREYGKAIDLLGPEISDLRSSKPLETLFAAHMLGLYEILALPYLTRGESWQAHINSSAAILNSFYTNGYGSPEELETLGELFQHIIAQMLINCMTVGRRPEIPLGTVERFIQPTTDTFQVLTIIYKATEQLVVWREAEFNVLDATAVNIAAMKIVSDCDELEIEMDRWLAEQPLIWKEEVREVEIEHIPAWLQAVYRAPGAPTVMRVVANLHIAQLYNLTRGTRIRTHCHALNALDVLIASAHTGAELAFWLETQHRFELRVMHHIDNVLASVYGQMIFPTNGKVVQKSLDVPTQRVMRLLWPLYEGCLLLARRDTLGEMDLIGRRLWARSFLCWLRDELGIKKCEAFVNHVDGNVAAAFG